jgi:hypothetical protein
MPVVSYQTDVIPLRRPVRGIAERGFLERITLNLVTAVPRAVSKALTDSADPMTKTLYEGIGAGVFPRSQLLAANQEIARRAQRDILSGWRARLPARSGPYRRGSNPRKDRLSGKLGEALASPAMVRRTTDRAISFLDPITLNAEARHWYRVNYGAYGGYAIVRRPKAYPVTVAGHTVFTLRDELRPAPNSWLPLRFGFEGSEFVPLKGPARTVGGGHRAALFTDLGFQSVGRNVDPVYREMIFRYFKGGGLKKRYELKGATVHVPE